MIQPPDRVRADADEQQRKSALRLGLGEPLRTPAEVGRVLGVAPESVRRLERSALQKLGHLMAWLDCVLAHDGANDGAPPDAMRYFPQREPLATAGAPRRELLQRDRRAAAP